VAGSLLENLPRPLELVDDDSGADPLRAHHRQGLHMGGRKADLTL
jgi:hypothetical protein